MPLRIAGSNPARCTKGRLNQVGLRVAVLKTVSRNGVWVRVLHLPLMESKIVRDYNRLLNELKVKNLGNRALCFPQTPKCHKDER